ncbi:MAG TPA: hypothetical protein PLR83_00795 [Pyrinomonadaceae bacterium]|nr:hypothetical protein [Pyrinomonadaceae bacterium]
MRALSTFLLFFVVFTIVVAAQGDPASWQREMLADPLLSKTEQKAAIKRYDLASLWTPADSSSVFGFIGKNYRRIRIKILSATKSGRDSLTYNITGASLVGDTFRRFEGTIKVVNARMYKAIEPEMAAENIKKRGIVFGDYSFVEKGSDAHSGIFSGTFYTAFYITDAGKIHYDDLEDGADAFTNNQFAGRWRSKDGKLDFVCNWGDSRIPLSGDLDVGDGEFSPNPKYFKNGWQVFHDAYINQDADALKQEQREWWNPPATKKQ